MFLEDQHVDRSDDDGLPSTRSRSSFSLGVIAVALVASAIFPATSLITDHEPPDLEINVSHQIDDAWIHEDVAPHFALDGRPFVIEPAAGPFNSADIQTCHGPVVQLIACDQQIAAK